MNSKKWIENTKKYLKHAVFHNGGLPSVILGGKVEEKGKKEGYLQASKEYAAKIELLKNEFKKNMNEAKENSQHKNEVIDKYRNVIDTLTKDREIIENTIETLQKELSELRSSN